MSLGAVFAVEMLMRSCFSTKGLTQYLMRPTTVDTASSFVWILGRCSSVRQTFDLMPCTMSLNCPRNALRYSDVMYYRLMAPAFRLNRAVPPGVCVSLFNVTSLCWSTGMRPNGLLFDICTENWPALRLHTHEDSSLEDLSSEHSLGTCPWHSLIYRMGSTMGSCFVRHGGASSNSLHERHA